MLLKSVGFYLLGAGFEFFVQLEERKRNFVLQQQLEMFPEAQSLFHIHCILMQFSIYFQRLGSSEQCLGGGCGT